MSDREKERKKERDKGPVPDNSMYYPMYLDPVERERELKISWVCTKTESEIE